MKYGTIPGIEQPVSRVILGSMALRTDQQDNADALLDRFLERGGTMVDTAYVYRGGNSERAIGSWLRRREARDRLLILTKGAHHDKTGRRVTPTEIAFDLGQSLERLGTDHIDLYVLHRDDPQVPVGPIVSVLNDQAERGRIRAYGGSNWTVDRVVAANEFAAAHGMRPFAVSSPNLALAVPKEPMWMDCVSIAGDDAAQAWYRQTQTPIMSWSSQAGGFFTGRFSPESTDNADMMRVYYSDQNWERLRRAQQLGQELGKSAVQVALAWVLNQPDLNVFALVGPQNLDELNSSLDAAEIELTPQQVKWLNLDA